MRYFTRHSVQNDTLAIEMGRIVYYILGLIEMLLAFRFIFKLLGANPRSPFVDFIYDLSAPVISPFVNIFSRTSVPGIETGAVFEPATLVAMIVYMLIARILVELFVILLNPSPSVERDLDQ